MRLPSNLGMILLAIWLIATGAIALLSGITLSIGTLLAVLALAAGILLLLGR